MSWREKIKSLLHNLRYVKQERGAIFVLTALLLPVLFGFMGLAYDVGNLYMHKARLQNVTDAAALAGGAIYKERNDQGTDTKNGDTIKREGNHLEADKAATDYINKNKINLGNDISIDELSALSYSNTTVSPAEQVNATTSRTVTTASNKIFYRVIASEMVDLHFLPVIMPNTRQQKVVTTSVAQLDNTTTTTATTVTNSGGGGNNTNKTILDNLFTFSDYLYVPNKYGNYDFDGSSETKDPVKSTFDGDIIYTRTDSTLTSPEPDNSLLKQLYPDSTAKHKPARAIELLDYTHYAEYLNIDFASSAYINIFNKKFVSPNTPVELEDSQMTASYIKDSGNSIFIKKTINNGNLVLDRAIGSGTSPIFLKYKDDHQIIKINSTADNVRPIIIVYLGTNTIQFDNSSNGTFRGLIYAPNGHVQSNNNNNFKFYGNIIAKKIELQGDSQEYHLVNYLADDTDFSDLPTLVRSGSSITQSTFDTTFEEAMDALIANETDTKKKQIYSWIKEHFNDQESFNSALDSGKSQWVNGDQLQTIAKADIIQEWTLIYQETLNRLKNIEGFKLSDLNTIDKFNFDSGVTPAQETGGGPTTTTTTTTNTVPGVFRLINPRIEQNPYFNTDSNI